MGKRKDRRLAAVANAGRRFKLDLFAEPSEATVGSSVQEEVDGDPYRSAGVADSPSSSDQVRPYHCEILNESPSVMRYVRSTKALSGFRLDNFSIDQQPPNPLLLLGQYSDDELDEEMGGSIENENENAEGFEQDDQGPSSEIIKNTEVVSGGDVVGKDIHEVHASSGYNQPNKEGEEFTKEDVPIPSDSFKVEDSAEQNSKTGVYDPQVIGDVGSGWKMVLHEESNQYYYWNMETGETSWDVPEGLPPATQLTSDTVVTASEQVETAPGFVNECHPNFGVEVNSSSTLVTSDGVAANGTFLPTQAYDNGYGTADKYGGYETQVEVRSNIDDVNKSLNNESQASNGRPMHDNLVENGLSTQLLKQGEQILGRLDALRGSEGHQQCHNWLAVCRLEIEIRLSDMKSLFSCGQSLLPFWNHSEKQLKRLEAVINEKIYQLAKHAAIDETGEYSDLAGDKFNLQEDIGVESGADGNGSNASILVSPEIPQVPIDASSLTVSSNQEPSRVDIPLEDIASANHMGSVAAVSEHVNRNTLYEVSDAVEDIDMDVDMEVDETIPTSSMRTENTPSSLECVNPPAENSNIPIPPSEEWVPPLPADNEMIPPPPPDNEQVPPPPPPEEPSEPTYAAPPSYTETGQFFSASEDYNANPQGPNYQYYVHAVSGIPSGNLYGLGDSYPVVPQPTIYYDPVTSTYSGTASVVVTPIQSVAYYNAEDGTSSTLPVATSTGPSQLYDGSGLMNYNTSLDQSGQHDTISLKEPNLNVMTSAANSKTEMVAAVATSSSATIQGPDAGTCEDSGVSNAIATTASASNLQTKAVRAKKRTVASASSLRANKKVSSLVDKWKAAKEELNEAEEEPENAYEILERKRQREIEEWRNQQIASGEARNNANFQPLGGDWREKVKRRRAQKAREGGDISVDVHPEGKQKPDLAKISRELPSGWQAYWDESSKQVYYGNLNTSETRWERPAAK